MTQPVTPAAQKAVNQATRQRKTAPKIQNRRGRPMTTQPLGTVPFTKFDLDGFKHDQKWNRIRYTLRELVSTAAIVGLGVSVIYLSGLVLVFALGA